MIPVYNNWYLEPKFVLFFLIYAIAISHVRRLEALRLQAVEKEEMRRLEKLQEDSKIIIELIQNRNGKTTR